MTRQFSFFFNRMISEYVSAYMRKGKKDSGTAKSENIVKRTEKKILYIPMYINSVTFNTFLSILLRSEFRCIFSLCLPGTFFNLFFIFLRAHTIIFFFPYSIVRYLPHKTFYSAGTIFRGPYILFCYFQRKAAKSNNLARNKSLALHKILLLLYIHM